MVSAFAIYVLTSAFCFPHETDFLRPERPPESAGSPSGQSRPLAFQRVAAWPELPEAIKAGIVAMVKAALGGRP